MPYINQESFGGGEWSQAASARVGLQSHASSCRKLTNAIVTRTGAAMKRWPLQYLVNAASTTGSSWLVPYRLRAQGEFILEFYGFNIRVFPNVVTGGQQGEDQDNFTINWSLVQQGVGHVSNSVTLTSPINAATLKGVQYVQAGGTLYIASEGNPVISVSFTGASWNVRAVPFRSLEATLATKTRTLRNLGPVGWGSVGLVVDDAPLTAADILTPDDVSWAIWRVGTDMWFRSIQQVDTRQQTQVGMGINDTTLAGFQAIPYSNWVGPWYGEGTTSNALPGTIRTQQTLNVVSPIPPGGVFLGNSKVTVEAAGGVGYFSADTLGAMLELDPESGANAGIQEPIRMLLIESLDGLQSNSLYSTANTRVIHVFAGATFVQTYENHRFRFLKDRGNPRAGAPFDGVCLLASGKTGAVRVSASADVNGVPPIFFDPGVVGQEVTMNGGRIRVDAYISAQQVSGTVVKDLEFHGPTANWSSVSGASVNPRAIAYHQDRLWLGGVPEAPNRLFASRVGDYEDFTIGTEASDGLSLSVAAEVGGGIQWLRSATDLLVGTEDSVFAVKGAPVTATNLGIDHQTADGGLNVQTELSGAAAVFVGRGGKEIKVAQFQDEAQRFLATNLTDTAFHLFAGKRIKQMAFIRDPEHVLIVLFTDGTVSALSYFPENGVQAWSPWVFQPGHKCISICPRRPLHVDRDEVWAIMERPVYTAEGQQVIRTIERWNPDSVPRMDCLQPLPFGVTQGAAMQIAFIYAGNRVAVYVPPSPPDTQFPIDFGSFLVSIGGEPGPSPGDVFGLGWIISNEPAPNGGNQLQIFNEAIAYEEVCVGYEIPFELRPARPATTDREGVSLGRKHTIQRARVELLNSVDGEIQGFKIHGDWTNREASEQVNGWIDAPGLGVFGSDDDADISVTHSRAHPFQVVAVNRMVDLGD